MYGQLKMDSPLKSFKLVEECRICKGSNLVPYLDIGNIPLVNRYINPSERHYEESLFPLQVKYCKDCSLSQLSIVVDPTLLFKNYFYRSSISQTFRNHCYEFAEHSVDNFDLKEGDLIVDIASNDGCTLQEFKKFGLSVLGVDPAENLAALANAQGIQTISEFWSENTAQKIIQEHGKAKMIMALNVFAHVDNVDSFLSAINILLKDDGVFAVEVPYLVNFINKMEFDTIYHEHLSYFLVKPLLHLFKRHKLDVFDIKKFIMHGGSIRIYAKKESNHAIKGDKESIKWLLELEKDLGLYDERTYFKFSHDIQQIKDGLIKTLYQLKWQGKTIAGYGASAKGTVLTNYCGIGKDILDYIVDDTPEKQKFLTPGTHISIVDASYLKKNKPDYLLLLAWNFAEELMQKTKDYKDSGGRYIIPIPSIKII